MKKFVGAENTGFTPLFLTKKKFTGAKRAGFTLFEIMVVVAIVGLVLAIALPNLMFARQKAAKNLCLTNQKIIFTAATMYSLKDPESMEEMTDGERLDALVEEGYLKGIAWQHCPAGGGRNPQDYVIIMESGSVADIECVPRGAEHSWSQE